jgi:hypothetical protein
MRTAEDILLCGENLELGSDSDISDASQIWSDYGDEILVDKEPKLIRWNPSQKKISQRINFGNAREKQSCEPQKKIIDLKKLKHLTRQKASAAREPANAGLSDAGDLADVEEAGGLKTPPDEAGLSFVPTGAGASAGKGVYFLDFSNEFRKSLKKAREELERQKGMTHLQKAEINWMKSMKADGDKTLQEKLACLKLDSLSRAGRFTPKRTQSKGSPLSSQHSSRKGSPERTNPQEGVVESHDVVKKESRTQALVKIVLGNQSQKKAEEMHDAMGNKWPKTMWDNTENYWDRFCEAPFRPKSFRINFRPQILDKLPPKKI